VIGNGFADTMVISAAGPDLRCCASAGRTAITGLVEPQVVHGAGEHARRRGLANIDMTVIEKLHGANR